MLFASFLLLLGILSRFCPGLPNLHFVVRLGGRVEHPPRDA